MIGRRPIALLALFSLVSLPLVALPAGAQDHPVRWVMPADGQQAVWPAHRIGIEFDRDMDARSVEAALSVAPAVNGHFEWAAGSLRRVDFVPRDLYAPGVSYRVELAAGVKDAAGNPVLPEGYRWSFAAGEPTGAPRFSSGPPVHPASLSGGRGVPIQPGYPRVTFDFRLYQLEPDEFAAYYGALVEGDNIVPAALAPGDRDPAKRWSGMVDASADPAYVQLPPSTQPGLYLLEAAHPLLAPARTLVIYSDYWLAAKSGRNGLLAWVSSIPDGTTAHRASLSTFDAAGQLLATTRADDDGLLRLARRGEAVFLVAEVAGHPAALALDGWWYSEGYYYALRRSPVKEAPDLLGHVFTDRPIYRPGHTVQWKASLRRVGELGPQPLSSTVGVTATVRDATGNSIQETTHWADEFGSVSGSLVLGDEVSLGGWRVDVQAAGRTVIGRFQVEEYVKPDFEVDVASDKPYYIRGASARLTVQADYYFGQPVAGGEVTVRVYDNDRYRRSRPLVEHTGALDETGGFDLVAELPLRTDTDGRIHSHTFVAEAEVTDASRRPVYGTTNLPVHPANHALSLRNLRYGVNEGQPVVLDIATTSHDGKPAAGRVVDVVATRSYWRAGGSGSVRESVTTDNSGRATLKLTGLAYGWYRIEATSLDDGDREAYAQSYAWIASPRSTWHYSDSLDIDADRTSYSPGDTALLLVRSPITTTALVTLEADEVLAERVVEVAGATSVEVPITARMAPGVTACVTLWEPLDPSNRSYTHLAAEGRLLAAETRLIVPASDKRLSVEVVPDSAEGRPGEELGITLRVTDVEGVPVKAQLALAVVDKAVLALAPDPNGEAFDAFWSFSPSTINTHDSQRLANWYVRYEYDRSRRYYGPPSGTPPTSPPGTATASPTGTPAAAPTRAPGAPEEPDEEVRDQPRREFPDTAYWNPSIETDEKGEARIQLVLPDTLTTWQALARAIDLETRAGQGTGEVVVSKPVIADPALPRFAVQGDTFVLDVLARNYATTDTIAGECSLTSPGLIQLDRGERRLELPFGETRVARWSVVAADVGVHEQTAWLSTPAGEDGIALPLEVQPFVVPERFAFSGAVTGGPVTETFTVPFEAHPAASTVEILLTPSLAAGILDGIEGLLGYPYGCVEQTMSRMLPNAIVGRLVSELDVVAPGVMKRLPELMRLGLQKLYGFQHSDGSWGWWYGGQNTYMTAYVLQGLWASREAGYDVDAGVLERGFGALARQLQVETDPRTKAYALFVLSEAGRSDVDAALATFEQREGLDAFAMGALALALDAAGREAEAAQALAEMAALADETATSAHWPRRASSRTWGYHSWRTMSSTTKNTAMALLALSRLQPDSPLAPKAIRWLMSQRQGHYYGSSTHDTAWSVLALTDWIVASGELWATYDWRVALDGRPIAQGHHEGGSEVTPLAPVVISGDLMAPGEHELVLDKTGDGTLYYTVAGRLALYYPDFAAVAAGGSGIEVSRQYMPIEGRAGTDGWQAGDLLNVRLTLTTDQDLHYVIIEDNLPAGFEAINTALDTETDRLPSGQRPWWRWWGYERREIRDDTVTFFDSWLRAGRHTFEYAVRAVTPGRFAARPAEAYTMYRPEIWGRSESQRVEIATRKVASRPRLPGDFDHDCRLTQFDASLVAADWGSDELRRDVNSDGRLDAADIATADGRAGLKCGDSVPLPAGAAGRLRLQLEAPDEIAQREIFDLTLALSGAAEVGAWEVSLRLPEAAFDIIGVERGESLPGARSLGPVMVADDLLRVGGYLPGGRDVRGNSILAVVRLRPRTATRSDIGVSSAQVVRPDGGAYEITVDDVVVSPAPWVPVGLAWLPRIVR